LIRLFMASIIASSGVLPTRCDLMSFISALAIGHCKLHSQYQAKAHSYHLFNIFSTLSGFGGKHLSQRSESWH
jgi:hypothetical protein